MIQMTDSNIKHRSSVTICILSLFAFSLAACSGPTTQTPQPDQPSVIHQHPDYTLNTPVSFAEKMPEFIGGQDSLNLFIKRHLRYPEWEKEHYIEGKVIVSFVIDTMGTLTDIQILKSVPEAQNFEVEVFRMLKLMPNWIPGEQDGKKVPVKFTLPVDFKL
jgi:TonB family protein